ncbi:MAG: hypothetical protein KA124_10965 [Luteimonas sp.]|nr:hypothetical protein [Luteimonas sp.]
MNTQRTSPLPRAIRARGTIVSIALACVGLCAVPALAGERLTRTPQGDVLVLEAPAGVQRKLSTAALAHPFATDRQRAAATPLPWPADRGPAKSGAKDALPPEQRLLPPSIAEGGAAPSFAEYLARQHFDKAWRNIDDQRRRGTAPGPQHGSDKDGTHQPWVRYPGNLDSAQWTAAPWNKIGKLYFTTPDGGSSYCTANVAGRGSMIVTAAHCVYTPGQGFHRDFVFVPAERHGIAPYGRYGWQSAAVLDDWTRNGDRRWDVAVLRLANEATSGLPVTDYVGWLGRSWDRGYAQPTHSHGYAANLSTQFTHICEGQTWSSGWEGADVLVQGCDMTYGSSGGGWLIHFTPNSHAGNYVNGVVSGPHMGDFGNSYVGPRFSSANIVPLCSVMGC